jgi:hypothetical protein
LSATAEVITVDFVRVVNGNMEEAVYFYENNWKKFRIAAVKKGIINSFKLLVKSSQNGQTDILLITAFESQEQYERREENFSTVMRDTREGGPALLNNKSPAEFREVIDRGMYTSH